MDSSVALHNVVVEVDPQVFEVANLEESDVVFEDAPVDVRDVLDHDDVRVTEFLVNDSTVAGSHLTKIIALEVSPIAADQEAIGETNHCDIDPLSGSVVSRKQTRFVKRN